MWIRFEMAPLDPDPDPGQSNWFPKRKTKSEISTVLKKSNENFAEGLMVFTRAWEPSINVFTAICDQK